MPASISNLLPVAYSQFLRQVGLASAEFKIPVYLVGGVVRDLLVGKSSAEIDLLVEGSAKDFSEAMFEKWPSFFSAYPAPEKVLHFSKYLTSKLCFDGELLEGVDELDFASSRAERYASSGAAPEVWSSTLADDLARRDFSANAIAMSLSQNEFGQLVDLHNGLQDIEKKQLRVLHSQSFVDDPARLIRGVRFISRLGFSWEHSTAELFEAARSQGLLKNLTPLRRFDEFRKALAESDPYSVLRELLSQGLLDQLVEGVSYSEQDLSLLKKFNKAVEDAQSLGSVSGWRVAFSLLNARKSAECYEEILANFELGKKVRKNLLQLHELMREE